jgi:hypothetical protein
LPPASGGRGLADPDPNADPCDIQPNGCGPIGILGWLSPDCPLGLACFTIPCNRHDLCYVTCGRSKADCDDTLYRDMVALCTGRFTEESGARARCKVLAYIYWQVVARFGGPYYARDQQQACACSPPAETAGPAAVPYGATPDFPRPFEDADDDLLPDVWESRVGLDPADPADAWHDNDADGRVNLQEFILETDPMTADPG